ncbi:hypothetical protein EMCRGX_G034757, partial [Ephydatia muelleri]
MASVLDPRIRVSTTESKSTRSPKTKSSLKHKSRSQFQAVKESEQSLNQLLEDFEEGRLNAFGNSDMLQKMNGIREMQEKLTLKHFEIDQVRINQERKVSATEEVKDDLSLHELTQALEALGNEILYQQILVVRSKRNRPRKSPYVIPSRMNLLRVGLHLFEKKIT